MYQIEKDQFAPEKFLAGDFPVVRKNYPIKGSGAIQQHMPVVIDAAGAEAVQAATAAKVNGIAAADGENGQVICYLTGEFFADSLVLPSGVTAESLEPALRTVSIFLR